MLNGRSTTLKYDGHFLDPFEIDNRIEQGDLLSMVLYQYYNVDLLDIPKGKNEKALAYMDNTIMVATAENFSVAHKMLADMMCRAKGVLDWSKTYNLPLKYTKLTLIDFVYRSSSKLRTVL
jgi:hypothetical protein